MKPMNESSSLNYEVHREPHQVKSGNIILSEWTREGDPKFCSRRRRQAQTVICERACQCVPLKVANSYDLFLWGQVLFY